MDIFKNANKGIYGPSTGYLIPGMVTRVGVEYKVERVSNTRKKSAAIIGR